MSVESQALTGIQRLEVKLKKQNKAIIKLHEEVESLKQAAIMQTDIVEQLTKLVGLIAERMEGKSEKVTLPGHNFPEAK